MPHGYYTIEQWKKPNWEAVAVLPFGLTQTGAELALEKLGKPGFYRLVQTQRIIWCEKDGLRIRMRKSHTGSPENLKKMQDMFDESGGRFPVEIIKAARQKQKRNQMK